jgi:hypothetical protein
VKPSKPTSPDPQPPSAVDDFGEQTGLRLFRTWRSVYLFVLGSFVLWLALLYGLSVVYS